MLKKDVFSQAVAFILFVFFIGIFFRMHMAANPYIDSKLNFLWTLSQTSIFFLTLSELFLSLSMDAKALVEIPLVGWIVFVVTLTLQASFYLLSLFMVKTII